MEGRREEELGEMTDGEEGECRNERRHQHATSSGNTNEDTIPDKSHTTSGRYQPCPPKIFVRGFNHLRLICQEVDDPLAGYYI